MADATEPDGQIYPVVDRAGFSAERLARIDALFQVEVARGIVPGAVLLVERRGEVVMKRAWGYRSRSAGSRMALDTIFRIYSMTKPLVSVAAMMLAAEGRLYLEQPVSDFVPGFADVKVRAGERLLEPERLPTVHDLLRHTAGLVYGRSAGPVGKLYRKAALLAADITNEEFAAKIAMLPLANHPGRVWDYSHATDVLGRVVEVAAGRSLAAVLRQRLLEPLGMKDTGFVVPEQAHDRVAEPFPDDTLSEYGGSSLFDPRIPRAFEAGGFGLVSTLDDYASFARMLLDGGASGRTVYVSKQTLSFITADHIAPSTGILRLPDSALAPGYGFGLGFAVRREIGGAPYPGSPGEFNWAGIGGTHFWVDPARDLLVVLLTQSPRQRQRYRQLVRAMVYDALVGEGGLKVEKKRRRIT